MEDQKDLHRRILVNLGVALAGILLLIFVVPPLVRFLMPLIVAWIVAMIAFGIGVVIGIFAVAKLIEMLMEKYEALTYSGIMGLVVASPVVILMSASLAGMTVLDGVTGVITFIIGTVIALCLGKE